MNGRVYDYNLGRFMSVDPFIQSPTSTQSVNPYSYIMNNPLSGTDPTGFTSTKDEIEEINHGEVKEQENEEEPETSNGQNNEKRTSDRDSRSANKVGTFGTNRIVSRITGTNQSGDTKVHESGEVNSYQDSNDAEFNKSLKGLNKKASGLELFDKSDDVATWFN